MTESSQNGLKALWLYSRLPGTEGRYPQHGDRIPILCGGHTLGHSAYPPDSHRVAGKPLDGADSDESTAPRLR